MIYVALAEAAIIALLVWVYTRRVDQEARFLAEISREWAEERGRLVAAVKSPSYLPLAQPTTPHEVRKPRDLGALAAIGTIGEARPPEPEDDDV